MPLGDFAEAGSSPGPLPIGRALRFLAGIGAGFYFIWNLIQVSELVGPQIQGGYWVGVGFAWWYLSDAVVVGFGVKWGRWPQIAAIVISLALLVAGLIAYGEAWAPPLRWGLFTLVEFFYGYIAISFILASLFAVPG